MWGRGSAPIFRVQGLGCRAVKDARARYYQARLTEDLFGD